MKPFIPLALSALLFLTACGQTHYERVGSGAVTGAAIGVATGAFCCGNDPGANMAPGLFIGMAIGALIGLILPEPIFMNTHGEKH